MPRGESSDSPSGPAAYLAYVERGSISPCPSDRRNGTSPNRDSRLANVHPPRPPPAKSADLAPTSLHPSAAVASSSSSSPSPSSPPYAGMAGHPAAAPSIFAGRFAISYSLEKNVIFRPSPPSPRPPPRSSTTASTRAQASSYPSVGAALSGWGGTPNHSSPLAACHRQQR